jgi:small subunit ribosomal protein S3Ae
MSKTKNWYRVFAPKVFNEVELGEAIAADTESLKGRMIRANFSELAKDLTKHHMTCVLKIIDVIEGVARTELVGYFLSRQYIQRALRRNTTKIEDVIDVKMKDKNVRVKTTAITVYKTSLSQRAALQKAINAEMRKALIGIDMDTLILSAASSKIQRDVLKNVKSIFPVKFLEIRRIELIQAKNVKKHLDQELIVEVKKKESKHEGKKITIESEQEEIRERPAAESVEEKASESETSFEDTEEEEAESA